MANLAPRFVLLFTLCASILVSGVSYGSPRVSGAAQTAAAQIAHERAAVAMIQGDFVNAMPFFYQASDLGHADSSYLLGQMFANGLAVAGDDKRAAEYYRLAVDQGSLLAEPRLARFYLDGIGIERDAAKARQLYWRAAAWITVTPNLDDNMYLASATMQHYRLSNEYIEAVEEISALVSAGAQSIYQRSKILLADTAADSVLAGRLLLRPANAGHSTAQFDLAINLLPHPACLEGGRDGATWLYQSAVAGFASAEAALGRHNMKSDPASGAMWRALYWFE